MTDEDDVPLGDLLGGLELPEESTPHTNDRDGGDEFLAAIVINWRELLASDAPDAWNNLRDWVEWLIQRYDVPDVVIPDCWWRHGDLTEELSALYAAWVASFDSTDSGYGPVGWHERWSPAKDRLRKHYNGQCKNGHKTATPRTMPPADQKWKDWAKSSHNDLRREAGSNAQL